MEYRLEVMFEQEPDFSYLEPEDSPENYQAYQVVLSRYEEESGVWLAEEALGNVHVARGQNDSDLENVYESESSLPEELRHLWAEMVPSEVEAVCSPTCGLHPNHLGSHDDGTWPTDYVKAVQKEWKNVVPTRVGVLAIEAARMLQDALESSSRVPSAKARIERALRALLVDEEVES
jgi:hypothetical protein